MLPLEHRMEDTWVRSSYSKGILGAVWTITAITTFSFAARVFIRFRRFGRLQWDDLFVTLAWCLSIPLAAQTTVSALASRADGQTGVGPEFTNRILTQFFFYTSIWSIKLSFLIFFRQLGGTALERLRIYWRCVLGFTILTYLAVWAANPYHCFIKKGMDECANDPYVRYLMPITFGLACALDVLTDCLIMAMPFAILYRVRLTTRQRCVLYALFSLVVITLSVSITRAALASKFMSRHLNVTYLLFFTHLEASVAIIVACIGSFRALFTQDDRSRTPTYGRQYVSAPMRGGIPRTESTEDLHETDLQYMTPSKSTPTPSSRISVSEVSPPPSARLRDERLVG